MSRRGVPCPARLTTAGSYRRFRRHPNRDTVSAEPTRICASRLAQYYHCCWTSFLRARQSDSPHKIRLILSGANTALLILVFTRPSASNTGHWAAR